MMIAGYLLFFMTLVIFGGAAALALAWAISSGQMANFSRGATSIFAADEPIGVMTDRVLDTPLTPNPSPRWDPRRCEGRNSKRGTP